MYKNESGVLDISTGQTLSLPAAYETGAGPLRLFTLAPKQAPSIGHGEACGPIDTPRHLAFEPCCWPRYWISVHIRTQPPQ